MKLFLIILGLSASLPNAFNFDILDPAVLIPGQISYTVSLKVTTANLNYSRNCIGGMLSNWHILTTSQCLIHGDKKLEPEEIKIKANQPHADDVQYNVEKIITVHNHTHHHHHDISLLQLKHPIKFSESLSRIGLIDLIITAPTKLGAPKWCKNKVKNAPYELHVRTGKRNCGGSRVYRGKYIIYFCIKRGGISTEYCYGATGTPLLLGDILAGLNIAIP